VTPRAQRRVHSTIATPSAMTRPPARAATLGAIAARLVALGASRALALRALGAAIAAIAALSCPRGARADDVDATFAHGAAALREGRPSEAIADLEALADRGVIDPVVSFDRGLAYATRVRLGGEQPGDLGRAAHGFEEARDLTRDDALERDATRALATVRAEVARRRARDGDTADLEQSASLGETIVHLVPEDGWAGVAIAASLVTGIGLFVRARTRQRRARVAATVSISVAAPLLLTAGALVLAARSERAHRVDGVVVSASARPSDARGIALPNATPIPEGARVRILGAGSSSAWIEVGWGGLDTWIVSTAVRPLSRPR